MTENQIWDKLKSFGLNDFAAAGIMGNLFAESGLNAENLQNSGNKKLNLTDEQYTVAVDSGTYQDFVHDGIGYGLAQWTYWSRKQGLLNYAKIAGTSIGDTAMQLDYLWSEIQGYRSVMSELKDAESVRAASDAILLGYEKPADQSEAVRKKRALYGQAYYDRYVGKGQAAAGQIIERDKEKMTETQVREKIVAVMRGWIGLKRADKSHAPIIDTYNCHTPLPRGYRVTYKDEYCAATVSAAAIKAGYTDIMPVECSCSKLIEVAKKMDIWQENDAYVPSPADLILYDWQDSPNFSVTDNKGAPDHVGMVEKVVGTTITIIEGNMSGGIVGRRTVTVNGRYIRGYICPKYFTKATAVSTSSTVAAASGSAVTGNLKVGDVVKFNGSKHYTSANAASGSTARPGSAKISAISASAKHPYHVVHTDKTSNVYGWVDAADI